MHGGSKSLNAHSPQSHTNNIDISHFCGFSDFAFCLSMKFGFHLVDRERPKNEQFVYDTEAMAMSLLLGVLNSNASNEFLLIDLSV